jgi:hypothetical protein
VSPIISKIFVLFAIYFCLFGFVPLVSGGGIFYWCSAGGGVQLGPFFTAATSRPIVPNKGDYDVGEIGEMIGR